MRAILWYPRWNRSDRRWCSSVLTASTHTQAFIVSSWQAQAPLFFSIICIPLSPHRFTDQRVTDFRVHACCLLTSNVKRFRGTFLSLNPSRAPRWQKETVGQKRRAFKMEIISEHAISFYNSLCRETETELHENKGQDSLNPPGSIWKHFQPGLPHVSKIPQRLV